MVLEHESAASRDEKKASVALSSVVAAIFLTGFKVVVGFMTGSLGILAEALHSALDLLAAVMTYVAVRISAHPADAEHQYGHGKVENFSALLETLLLLVTCIWIIKEAVERLLHPGVHVDPNVWAFAVMFVSIAIDWSRSRALMKAAKKYQSQALEADAIHFSTDIWSSAVVILGLALVKIGQWMGPGRAEALAQADALAALGVAGIVLWVTARLGKETIEVLLDQAPVGLTRAVQEAVKVLPGVVACDRVRVRRVGPALFMDVVVWVARGTSLEQSHKTASAVEDHLRGLYPESDVVVHFEPVRTKDESIQQTIQAVANDLDVSVHDIVVTLPREGKRTVFLHLEVEADMPLLDAHRKADELEDAIKSQLEDVAEVNTHIEPRVQLHFPGEASEEELPRVVAQLRDVATGVADLMEFHEVRVQRDHDRLFVTVHCVFDGGLPIDKVHRRSSEIEGGLKQRMPAVERVLVHVEPPGAR